MEELGRPATTSRPPSPRSSSSTRVRSPAGFAASVVFLLALPLAALGQMLLSLGAVVIHGALALGSAVMSFAVFDFNAPRWAGWVASVSTAVLAGVLAEVAPVVDERARRLLLGAGARRLRIAFPYRYPGASGKEEVTVLTQTGGYQLESKGGVGFMEILIPVPRMGNEQVFSLAGGAGVIEVPLGKFAVQDVEIRSGLVATSPSERSQSGDLRKLSFRIGRVEVMP